jgi:hypothetical protein
MVEKTTQMRIYLKDLDRVKNFGRAGDSMAEALSRALDLAEEAAKIGDQSSPLEKAKALTT